MNASNCPDPDRLLALLDGSIDPAELAALEAHLETCHACLNFVAARSEGQEFRQAVSAEESSPDMLSIMALIARDAEGEAIPNPPTEPPRRGRIAPTIAGLTDLVEIGRGGLGTVYSALQGELGRRVAVKVLTDSFDESSRLRVLREARVLARLRHPNIVTIFESGVTDGSPYLVMELIEGGSLQERLNRGVLPAREAAATVRQLALAVGEAHSLGVVHRDLKPSNILIAAAGEAGEAEVAKLADFSLAHDSGQAERLTLTGQVIGTPAYMAPEQTGFDPVVGEVGPATDIHALGAILHACLTGRPPYRGGSSWETLTRVARGQFESIRSTHPEVSPDLERIAARCLETQPSRRYHSAFDLADDLGRYLEGRPVAARPVSLPVRLAKWAKRRPTLATAALLLMLLASIVAFESTYYVVQLRLAFDRLEVEQSRTREARDRSQQALAALTDDVVQGMLDRGSILNDKDLAFLRKVRGYYQEPILDGDAEGVESQRFRAKGLLRVGELCRRIGQVEEGRAAYEAAVEVYSKILEKHPDESWAAVDRANAQHQLCFQLNLGGRLAEGLAVADRMVAEFRPYVGTSIDRKVTLLGCLFVRADRIAALRRREEAEVLYEEAAGIARGLREARGTDPAFRRIEYVGLYNRGLNLRKLARFDRVEETYAEALKLAEGYAAESPTDLAWLDRELDCLDRLVDVRLVTGRDPAALQASVRQRELLRLRSSRFPNDLRQDFKLLEWTTTSFPLRKLRPPAEVEAEFREAIARGKKRIDAEPANYEIYSALTVALQNLGALLEEAGHYADSLDAFEQATALAEPWLKSGQQTQVIREFLRFSLQDSAIMLDKLGRPVEAIQRVERALTFADEPVRPALKLSLASYHKAAGHLPAARQAAEQAAEDPKQAEAARKLIEEIDSKAAGTAGQN